jgi:hypothetical protein
MIKLIARNFIKHCQNTIMNGLGNGEIYPQQKCTCCLVSGITGNQKLVHVNYLLVFSFISDSSLLLWSVY